MSETNGTTRPARQQSYRQRLTDAWTEFYGTAPNDIKGRQRVAGKILLIADLAEAAIDEAGRCWGAASDLSVDALGRVAARERAHLWCEIIGDQSHFDFDIATARESFA